MRNLYIEKSEAIQEERFFIRNSVKLIDHLRTQLDENFKVKLSIIKFLEVFGGKTALDALIKQVDDFYRVVRIAATKAIRKIEKRLELEEELQNNN